MLLSCRCLNVSINVKGIEVNNVEPADLGLSTEDQCDPFFKQGVGTVDLSGISKEQGSLVCTRTIGNWLIHRCLNCHTDTHAIHLHKGPKNLLVGSTLIRDAAQITTLKQSDAFSNVFRIVVNCSDDVEALPTPLSPSKTSGGSLPPPIHAGITGLQQQLAEALRSEAASVEERIRQYTEQQYAELEEKREKSHKEHRTLVSKLIRHSEQSSPSNLAMPRTPPVNSAITQQNLFQQLPPPPVMAMQKNVYKQKGLKKETQPQNNSALVMNAGGLIRKQPTSKPKPYMLSSQLISSSYRGGVSQTDGHVSQSLDTEGLFDLDGMEAEPREVCPSEEESDTDDSGSYDEGIHIPRSRTTSNMARSLPVTVPAYMPISSRPAEDSDEETRQDPTDIAASIKALAKSVHGEANVFGELPRPRVRTKY